MEAREGDLLVTVIGVVDPPFLKAVKSFAEADVGIVIALWDNVEGFVVL
jgi:hypothetical protein